MTTGEPQTTILFVCTANICRSPMAEAIFPSRRAGLRTRFRAASAGVRPIGGPADAKAEQVLNRRGLDLSRHTSRGVNAKELGEAALILAMERAHIAQLTTISRSAFAKTFGLTEIVALGKQLRPRKTGETIESWVARAHVGRQASDVLRADSSFDIADPHGGPIAGYERCADELTRLIGSLVVLIDGADQIR